jgi:hypothetical protein
MKRCTVFSPDRLLQVVPSNSIADRVIGRLPPVGLDTETEDAIGNEPTIEH